MNPLSIFREMNNPEKHSQIQLKLGPSDVLKTI